MELTHLDMAFIVLLAVACLAVGIFLLVEIGRYFNKYFKP